MRNVWWDGTELDVATWENWQGVTQTGNHSMAQSINQSFTRGIHEMSHSDITFGGNPTLGLEETFPDVPLRLYVSTYYERHSYIIMSLCLECRYNVFATSRTTYYVQK